MGQDNKSMEEEQNRKVERKLEYLRKFIADYQRHKGTSINDSPRTQAMMDQLREYKDASKHGRIVADVANEIYQIYVSDLQLNKPVPPDKIEKLNRNIDAGISAIKSKLQASTSAPPAFSRKVAPVVSDIPAPRSPEFNNPYRIATVKMLDANIKQVDQLVKNLEKSNRNIIKSTYKNMRKKALSFLGKTHISKLEIAQQLKAELTNIRRSADNVSPTLTTSTISANIQSSLQNALELEKKRGHSANAKSAIKDLISDISKPYQFPARNILNEAFTVFIDSMNDKHGLAKNVFQGTINQLANTDKFKNDPMYMPTPPAGYQGERTQAYDQNMGVGQFLAINYPLPTEAKRDQLIIDTCTHFFDAHPDHDLNKAVDFIQAFNPLRKSIEDISLEMSKDKPLLEVLQMRLGLFDQYLGMACDKAAGLGLNDMGNKLASVRDEILSQLPKELQLQLAKEQVKATL